MEYVHENEKDIDPIKEVWNIKITAVDQKLEVVSLNRRVYEVSINNKGKLVFTNLKVAFDYCLTQCEIEDKIEDKDRI